VYIYNASTAWRYILSIRIIIIIIICRLITRAMSAYLRRVLNVYDPEYATYAYFIL